MGISILYDAFLVESGEAEEWRSKAILGGKETRGSHAPR